MSAEFLITTLVVCVTPGIGVLYTLGAGLSRGARASVVAAFACTLGIVPHIAAAITGAAAPVTAAAMWGTMPRVHARAATRLARAPRERPAPRV